MPFIPIPSVVMAEMRYNHLGQQMENTLYFDNATDPSVEDLQALGESLIGWWTTFYAPQAHQNCILHEVFLTNLTSDTSAALSVVPDELANGEQSTDPLPGNVTLSIKFSTAGRGRSSRGRNYTVGAVETQVFGNQFAGAYVTAMVACYNQLPAIATGLGMTWVVASRFTDNAPRTEGIAIPITTVSAVNLDVDSQRRRLTGRGN